MKYRPWTLNKTITFETSLQRSTRAKLWWMFSSSSTSPGSTPSVLSRDTRMSWTQKVYDWKDGKENERKGELANEDWKEDGIKGSGALVIFVMGGGYGGRRTRSGLQEH